MLHPLEKTSDPLAAIMEPVPTSEEEVSKKPKESAFKQQRLRAWRPLLTPKSVGPLFGAVGLAFIAIGIGILVVSEKTNEKEIDYTNCVNIYNKSQPCYEITKARDPTKNCTCKVPFTLESDWPKDVIVYYGLTNFFQNHRSYVKSRDDNQLLGDIKSAPNGECKPFITNKGNSKVYIPCGSIANSLFSDSFEIFFDRDGGEIRKLNLNRLGIALEADKKYKFKNPTLEGNQTLEDVFTAANYSKPEFWHREIWELDPDNPNNNGLQNEDLMVWMRTAALPNFRKIYRKIIHENEFENGMPKGNYTVRIDYRYEVKAFSGTKSFILANTSIIGGKNNFMGIAYLVVGCVTFATAFFLFFIQLKFGQRMDLDAMKLRSRISDQTNQ